MKKAVFFLVLCFNSYLFAQTLHSPDTLLEQFRHVNLEDVVVSDSLTKNQLTANKIPTPTLELQLKKLEGINLISRGAFAQEVVYRGQADGRIQVKVNGMRIYNACTDRMDPSTSYVVANNLSSANVSSSGESLSNNNGLAGNVNLKTKEAKLNGTPQWNFGFSQYYLSNPNGYASNFSLSHNRKKLAFRINGNWQKSNNYSDGNGNEIAYSQFQKQNIALNTVYRINPKQFLKLDVIYDLATSVGYPALPMDVSIARGLIGGVTFSSFKGFGPFQQFDVKVYHNNIYHEMDDTQREDVFMHMDMPGWSRTSGITFDATNWKKGNHTFDFSTEYYTNYRRAEMTMFPNNGTEPPMFMLTWPDARLHGTALGFSNTFKKGKNKVTSTLRFDFESNGVIDKIGADQWIGMGFDMGENRSFLLPQIKSAYTRTLSQNHFVTGSASMGLRGPTTSELFGFYLFNAHDGFDYLGNPDLKPEQLTSFDIGYRFQTKKLILNSTVFTQFYQNYIFGLTTDYDAMTYGANGVREFDNIDQATFWGFEINSSFTPLKNLEAFGKFEYTRGFTPDFNLPLVPPLQGTIGLNYQYKAVIFSTVGQFAAEQNKVNPNYGDRYTPGYFLFDLGVEYPFRFKKMNASVSLNCTNLFNTAYRNHLNWGGIPNMGRNFMANLKVNL